MTIAFRTQLHMLKDWVILAIPADEDEALPSRGQVSVTGTMDGHRFDTVLEPDGRRGHWMRVTDALLEATGARPGDVVSIELTTTRHWPEPQVPSDLADALRLAPEEVRDKWQDITPMARWEWVRWINATRNQETRAIRIEKTVSKLQGSHRRPCCFDLAACTEPYLMKAGQLMELSNPS